MVLANKSMMHVFLLLLIINLGSCATILGKKMGPLAIDSDPDGADVYVNGYRMGTTPMTLQLEADKDYVIEFIKKGYKPVTRILENNVRVGWLILDILGGPIPVVVDAVSGNLYRFEVNTVNVKLDEFD